MPQPNVRDSIIAGPLANVSVAYKNPSYVADRVFPIIDNVSPRAKIARYLKGAWFRDEAGIRGPGGRAVRGGYPTDFLTVATKEYAFAKEVTDEDVRFSSSQGAPPLKPAQDAIEFCADKIDLSKEVRLSAAIRAATWSDGNAGGEDAAGLWSPTDGTNTFLADMRLGIKTIQSKTGLTPNRLLLDFGTYNALKECAAVMEKVKYTQMGVVTAQLLAAMLDLEEVLVAGAIKSTAKETKAGTDFTSAYVWETNAGKGMGFLFYSPRTPGLKTASAGYMPRVAYENGAPRRVMTWREEAEHQAVYEVAEETDIVITGTDCGYLWVDTFAT